MVVLKVIMEPDVKVVGDVVEPAEKLVLVKLV
jgi:hypothetical protein